MSTRTSSVLRYGSLLGWLGFCAGSLLVFSARFFWLGEAAAGFAWYLGWAGVLGSLWLLATGSRFCALMTLVLSGIHLAPELWLWIPNGPKDVERWGGEPLTIASCNLLWTNRNFEAVEAWLDQTQPDVIGFQEVGVESLAFLQSLGFEYPHLSASPALGTWNSNTWGTVFLARVPVLDAHRIATGGEIAREPMELTVDFDGEPLTLRNIHPPRPGKAWRIEARNAVFDCVAAEDWSGLQILLGDLNASSRSPAFSKLLKSTGLADSRQGFGRQPTFTTERPLPGLSIPIDHILISKGLQVLDRRTYAIAGSDHRSVVVQIRGKGAR